MCVLLGDSPVRHVRSARLAAQCVGIVGRLRRWHPLADRHAVPLIVFEFALPGRYRPLAARALWSLHKDIPWYSWQADDLGKRRVQA